MTEQRIIHVGIAEIKLGSNGDILKANLGSCVGIAFLWKKKSLYGLAHCLLPETEDEKNIIGAKYVNQAISSLVTLMKIKAEDLKDIEVYVAGGGNMLKQLSQKNLDHIGLQNLNSARKHLHLQGFRFHELTVGGDVGCKIILDCNDESVFSNSFEKSAEEI